MEHDPKLLYGYKLADIDETITRVPDRYTKDPLDTVLWEAKISPMLDAIDEWYGWRHGKAKLDRDYFKKEWYHWDHRFFKHFSFDDIQKIRFDCCIQSGFHNHYDPGINDWAKREDTPNYNDWYQFRNWRVINKIGSSFWRYGYSRDNWNQFVDSWESILNFDFGLPGFEVRLDMTTAFNEIGRSEFSGVKKKGTWEWETPPTYLDGPLAYNILYKGKHVLTIGFIVTAASLSDRASAVIVQIQSPKKKGNRAFYKIPGHHFDYAVSRFYEAFEPLMDTHLIECGNAAHRVKMAYSPDDRSKFKGTEHILNAYGRDLVGFTRGECLKFSGVLSNRLVSNPTSSELSSGQEKASRLTAVPNLR